jgi:hypothetical protein
MMNLDHICSKLGDSRSARKWYEEIIQVDPTGEDAQQAKDALAKLKK